MTLLSLMLAAQLAGNEIVLVERPLPNWWSEAEAAQCGLLEVRVEFKNSLGREGPEILTGEARHLKQKRNLASELAHIGSQISSVYDLRIACESKGAVQITITGNTPAGLRDYEIRVDDRLEAVVNESALAE